MTPFDLFAYMVAFGAGFGLMVGSAILLIDWLTSLIDR